MGVPPQLDGLFHGQFQIIMGALVAGLVHGNSIYKMDELGGTTILENHHINRCLNHLKSS